MSNKEDPKTAKFPCFFFKLVVSQGEFFHPKGLRQMSLRRGCFGSYITPKGSQNVRWVFLSIQGTIGCTPNSVPMVLIGLV